MCHLCWLKHPKLVRQKVESFQRPSFTSWYNHVYLKYPFTPEQAYYNNSRIPPYFGKGFAEGQHARLEEFEGKLPEVLQDMEIDWTSYIINHHDELVIV
jgi:hypothetical protein